jgi:protein-L-isoaspartate(D-aspartate) O-methyltransferase
MAGSAQKIELIMRLRRIGIVDPALLTAIERIPREQFVPSTFADQAYQDMALPIDGEQTTSSPVVVAQMIQALNLKPSDKVLEIGCGSGWQTAILAQLCRRVYSMDVVPSLVQAAEQRLTAQHIYNVTFMNGNGAGGWPAQAPFDKIIICAAASESLPKPLLEQVKDNGIIIAPIRDTMHEQHLWKIIRQGIDYTYINMGMVHFVPFVAGKAKSGVAA